MAMAIDPNTNKNTIIVGATTGGGSSETIASYSSRAGMFSDRYLMASGDTGLYFLPDSTSTSSCTSSAPDELIY